MEEVAQQVAHEVTKIAEAVKAVVLGSPEGEGGAASPSDADADAAADGTGTSAEARAASALDGKLAFVAPDDEALVALADVFGSQLKEGCATPATPPPRHPAR